MLLCIQFFLSLDSCRCLDCTALSWIVVLLRRFDHKRVPRENLLNSVADVTPDGQYQSAIRDPDQVLSQALVGLHSMLAT